METDGTHGYQLLLSQFLFANTLMDKYVNAFFKNIFNSNNNNFSSNIKQPMGIVNL